MTRQTPFDKHITTDPRDDDEREPQSELEYKCPKCGRAPDEHPEVPTPDGNNVMQVCPPICSGCNQIIVITDGKSECGGEGEGICCVFADSGEYCLFHPKGHTPAQVGNARASHQAAFRLYEPWHMSDDVEDSDEQDHTNPSYVLGAVLAQIEDLSIDDRCQVLQQALNIQYNLGDELPHLTLEGNCPRCNSTLIETVYEHYSECCNCGWSGSSKTD